MQGWSVPELCCINFQQFVEVAQGASRHTPSLRIIRAKLVQNHSQGQSDGTRLRKVQQVEGAQPFRGGM